MIYSFWSIKVKCKKDLQTSLSGKNMRWLWVGSLICLPVCWNAKAVWEGRNFLIGYLYITGLQNERQFHLIYCLTELKLDPKENNIIENNRKEIHISIFCFLCHLAWLLIQWLLYFKGFYLKLQDHSWKTKIQTALTETSRAQQFTAVITNVWMS